MALVLWCLLGSTAHAHKTSDSYLRLRAEPEVLTGQWSLALHDLEFAIGLDANEDGAITWGELKRRREAVLEYAQTRLAVEAGGERLGLRFVPELQVEQLANGGYAVLTFEAPLPASAAGVTVEYQAFFDLDRLHRGLLLLEQGQGAQQAVFSPVESRLHFEFERPQPWREFGHFTTEGVWHIWIGYDHILFLIALLLPAVLHREEAERRWVPVADLRGAFWNVFKVVTAFTVAHSITLSLAALEWVRLPSRLVESVIAGSIVVAALNNVRPLITHRVWGIALGFGLVHGFGFASVLADLGLPRGSLARALIGFNLGVELGQLAIVAVFLPVAFLLRRTRFYRQVLLRGGSVVIAVLAAWWMVERIAGG